MIRFFRKIRHRLVIRSKFSKYLMYAVGEIALVMIGILLALQVNNWNEFHKERVTEQKLLSALHEDLLVNIDRLNNDLILEQRTIDQANTVITHLDERKPYNSSLDIIFGHALYSPDIVISTSSYESIKFRGFDIILNDTLQRGIVNLYDVIYSNLIAETVRLENQLWPSSVLPMIHTHFRVDKNGNGDSKPTNYKALLDDAAFTNMLMHRTTFRILALRLKTSALHETELMVKMIENELNK